jgi:hypothetical protein
MDQSGLEEHLHLALDLFEKGKDFNEIRNVLADQGLDSEMISYVIRLVDEFAVEDKKVEEKIRTARLRLIFGVLVLGVGLLIAYMFYLREVLTGYYMIIAYTPIVAGAYLIWSGWKEKRRWINYQPEIDDTKFKLVRRIK